MKFSATGSNLDEFANIMTSLNKLKSKKFRQVKFISIHGISVSLDNYLASTICHILTYTCPTVNYNTESITMLKLKGKTYHIPVGIMDSRRPHIDQMKDFPDTIRLIDDNKVEYGCVINNVVFIYFDLPHRKSSSFSLEDFIEMATLVMQAGLDKAKPFKTKDRKVYAMKMFFRTGGDWVERKIKHLEENRDYTTKDLKSNEKRIIDYTRQIILVNAQIRSLREVDFRDQIFGCVDRISKMDKVEKIDFTSYAFIVHTKPIILKDKGRNYCLGKYKILYKLDGSLQIFNKDKLMSCQYDHPHINRGNCCLGNITDILKLIGTFNYDASTVILLKFLESYRESGSFIKLPDFMAKAFSHTREKKSELPISGSIQTGTNWVSYGRSSSSSTASSTGFVPSIEDDECEDEEWDGEIDEDDD